VSSETPLVSIRSGLRMSPLLVELAMRVIGRNLIRAFLEVSVRLGLHMPPLLVDLAVQAIGTHLIRAFLGVSSKTPLVSVRLAK
jgi:hypothetical protein